MSQKKIPQMGLGKKSNKEGCPYLFLAPMEGVGDRSFRIAMASIGGFDEATCDFIRVPKNAHIKSLVKVYDPQELGSIPLGAQIMGADPSLMAEMAQALEAKGALRIDINCGCPSNTVTGRGAGSSLLKEPSFLHEIAKAVVKSVSIPVSLKMRTGYEDTSLFCENLFAAQESGIAYLTLHARTKVDGYGPPAKWEYIQKAKSLLSIPVVGNGDILTVEDAKRMLDETGCDALMIGRGSIINPFIFLEIKAHFAGEEFLVGSGEIERYFHVYLNAMPQEIPIRTRVNKVKQLLSFLLKKNSFLQSHRDAVLSSHHENPDSLLEQALPLFN